MAAAPSLVPAADAGDLRAARGDHGWRDAHAAELAVLGLVPRAGASGWRGGADGGGRRGRCAAVHHAALRPGFRRDGAGGSDRRGGGGAVPGVRCAGGYGAAARTGARGGGAGSGRNSIGICLLTLLTARA